MDFKVTKREIIVALAISLILIGFGILISNAISDNIMEDNEKYFKALKIDKDENTFKYAIKTNIGWIMSYGKVTVVDGVKSDVLDGTYMKIKCVKERYTRHTRQVAHTRTVSDGKGGTRTETYYTTEVYYTWDYSGEHIDMAQKYNFLGVEFSTSDICFGNESHVKTVKESSDVRYQYYVIPAEFEGTMFGLANNNSLVQKSFYHNQTINSIIKGKENDDKWAVAGFWIGWILLIGLIDFGYVYLENKYLED